MGASKEELLAGFKAAGTLCNNCSKVSKATVTKVESMVGGTILTNDAYFCTCGEPPKAAPRRVSVKEKKR